MEARRERPQNSGLKRLVLRLMQCMRVKGRSRAAETRPIADWLRKRVRMQLGRRKGVNAAGKLGRKAIENVAMVAMSPLYVGVRAKEPMAIVASAYGTTCCAL